jgi:hypothetical protein
VAIDREDFNRLIASLEDEAARDAAYRALAREGSASASEALNSGKKLVREEKSEKDTPRPFDENVI